MPPHRLKVVEAEPSKRTSSTISAMGPGEPIREETARRILAGGLEKVAGPPPVKGFPLLLVAAIVAGFVTVVYSVASIR